MTAPNHPTDWVARAKLAEAILRPRLERLPEPLREFFGEATGNALEEGRQLVARRAVEQAQMALNGASVQEILENSAGILKNSERRT